MVPGPAFAVPRTSTTYKGNHMDQIKVKSVNAVDFADDLLKADVQTQRKDGALPALEDWELVLASGGEAVPCW